MGIRVGSDARAHLGHHEEGIRPEDRGRVVQRLIARLGVVPVGAGGDGLGGVGDTRELVTTPFSIGGDGDRAQVLEPEGLERCRGGGRGDGSGPGWRQLWTTRSRRYEMGRGGDGWARCGCGGR
jgi:hypothetical protein